MAKPNLALIPATIGDKVYSILPSDGVGDFDFDRASTATRINAQGLIEEVASGVNRLNYSLLDGEVVGCPHLLLEPSRTNSITHSNDFSQSIYGKIDLTITANQGISPDGTQNANLVVPNAAVGNRYLANNTGSNLKINTVFLKKKELRYVVFGNSQSKVIVDLENGTISAGTVSTNNFTIENYGNGWYRVSCYNTLDVNLQIQIVFGVDGSGSNIATNGTDGVYIYGFEIQNGSFPTSYIKTDGSQNTRAAETCNGSGNASTFNDSEGVLMAEISALADDLTNRAITISDKTSNNRIFITYYAQSNGLFSQIISNGVIQATLTAQLPSIKNSTKVLVKYKQNDFALWVNGFEVSSDEIGVTPIGLDDLSFDRGTGTLNFYGKTKQIQYFDTTDIDLEQLTSWDSFRDMAQAQLYSVE